MKPIDWLLREINTSNQSHIKQNCLMCPVEFWKSPQGTNHPRKLIPERQCTTVNSFALGIDKQVIHGPSTCRRPCNDKIMQVRWSQPVRAS